MNLPFKMKLGIIKKMQVHIPYMKLSSQPCTAQLSEIYLVIQTQESSEWILRDRTCYDYKVKKLEDYISRYIRQA